MGTLANYDAKTKRKQCVANNPEHPLTNSSWMVSRKCQGLPLRRQKVLAVPRTIERQVSIGNLRVC